MALVFNVNCIYVNGDGDAISLPVKFEQNVKMEVATNDVKLDKNEIFSFLKIEDEISVTNTFDNKKTTFKNFEIKEDEDNDNGR